jgi:hypothetical protein
MFLYFPPKALIKAKQSKTLVASECYHVVMTTKIRMNPYVWKTGQNMRNILEGGRGTEAWNFFQLF